MRASWGGMLPGVALVGVLLLGGCTSAPKSTLAGSTPEPATASSRPTPSADSTIGVDLGDNAHEIVSAIRDAFGPMLKTVSAEAITLKGITDDGGNEYTGHRVRYELVDCPVVAETFVPLNGETGFVPPITAFYDMAPLGRDRMDPVRFRELLRAYGQVTHLPFGDLVSYATAVIVPEGVTATVGGNERAVAGMWVITAGMKTQRELRQRLHSDEPGYVFAYPVGGVPEYLGIVSHLGRGPDFSD